MRKVFLVCSLAMALILGGSTVSIADQSISIDLANFTDDGLGGNDLPNMTIYGVNDGDSITIQVLNSTEGFLGYINDGAGNSINIQGNALDLTNNSGQFYGPGIVSSLSSDQSINGTYTINIVLGANSRLNPDVFEEGAIAGDTSDPDNAAGWLILDWRQYMVNELNWKAVSIVRSGTAQSSTSSQLSAALGNSLFLRNSPTASFVDGKFTCQAGDYSYLNAGSTQEGVNLSAIVYTLFVDGRAISQASHGQLNSIPNAMRHEVTAQLQGSANFNSASWDLTTLSNYSAHCTVQVFQGVANLVSTSNSVDDSKRSASKNQAIQAWEDQRASATAANFTQQAREMRKRIAARSGN